MKTRNAILMLSLLALTVCLNWMATPMAYSQSTSNLPNIAQDDSDDEPSCNDSDSDGQCDTNPSMD